MLNKNYYIRGIWLVIVIAVYSLCISNIIYADDTTTGSTTINVSSSIPPTEGIMLEQAPNLDFGEISPNHQNIVGNGDNVYKIKDLANQTVKFQIQVEISDFQSLNNADKLPINNIWYHVAPNADNALQGVERAGIYHQPATAITSGTNNKNTDTSGNVSAKMVLNPRKVMLVKPGSYSATIQHTIVVGV